MGLSEIVVIPAVIALFVLTYFIYPPGALVLNGLISIIICGLVIVAMAAKKVNKVKD